MAHTNQAACWGVPRDDEGAPSESFRRHLNRGRVCLNHGALSLSDASLPSSTISDAALRGMLRAMRPAATSHVPHCALDARHACVRIVQLVHGLVSSLPCWRFEGDGATVGRVGADGALDMCPKSMRDGLLGRCVCSSPMGSAHMRSIHTTRT